jgi:hypothetical protein
LTILKSQTLTDMTQKYTDSNFRIFCSHYCLLCRDSCIGLCEADIAMSS